MVTRRSWWRRASRRARSTAAPDRCPDRVHRGVYRVGHRAPSVEARYLAAVLACGEGAVLSGRAAAYLWGLLKGPAPPAGGHRADRAAREGGQDQTRTTSKEGEHDLARHPDHHRGADPGRPGCCRRRNGAGARLPRSRGAPPHHPEAGRSGAGSPPERQGRRHAAGDHARRGQASRSANSRALPRTPARSRASVARRPTARPASAASTAAGPTISLTVELDSYRYHHSRHAWEHDRRREREARRPRRRVPPLHLERRLSKIPRADRLPARSARRRRCCASPPAPTGAEASSTPRSLTSSLKRRSASAARS